MSEREALNELERAWSWREARGLFGETEALRVFHGAGESAGALRSFAIDRFKNHYWVTEWEARSESRALLPAVERFLRAKDAESAALILRPEKGVPEEPKLLIGPAPEGRFEVSEGTLKFWIQVTGTRHPGLFLDHAPLRHWLQKRARGWKVLNTFAYTGSLSVSAGAGGAEHVTTLDLSKPTIDWARENWKLNTLPEDRADFIAGDVFEWLPRLAKKGRRFDCVLLDPPSFSRSKHGEQFSTAKDLRRLHELAIDLLEDEGVLVTSINSANVSWSKFEADLLAAAQAKRARFELLFRIEQPETFPTRFASAAQIQEDRYLKGFALRRVRA